MKNMSLWVLLLALPATAFLALGSEESARHAIGAKGLSTERYGGHYFWDRLVRDGGRLDSFRARSTRRSATCVMVRAMASWRVGCAVWCS